MASCLMSVAGPQHAYSGATDVYTLPYLTVACSFAPALGVKTAHDFAHITSLTPLFLQALTIFIAYVLKQKPFQ